VLALSWNLETGCVWLVKLLEAVREARGQRDKEGMMSYYYI